jgi:hypothetical protein
MEKGLIFFMSYAHRQVWIVRHRSDGFKALVIPSALTPSISQVSWRCGQAVEEQRSTYNKANVSGRSDVDAGRRRLRLDERCVG